MSLLFIWGIFGLMLLSEFVFLNQPKAPHRCHSDEQIAEHLIWYQNLKNSRRLRALFGGSITDRQTDRGRKWLLMHLHLLSPHTKDGKQTLAWEVWSRGERLAVQMARSGRAASKTIRGLRERVQAKRRQQLSRWASHRLLRH